MREVYRHYKVQLGNYYILMLAKPGLLTSRFVELEEDMQNFIQYIKNQ